MIMKKYYLVFIFFLFLFSIFAQNDADLPSGYRALRLGMDIETVKNELKSDALFGYRGEQDVSLLPNQEVQLIETEGYSFIQKAWFQFVEGKLYSITLQMDISKIDYGTFFQTLTEKYGKPHSLSPEQTRWENDIVLMSLERPLFIKYIDKKVRDSLLEESRVEDAAFEISRDVFLESF